jgi:glycosyltransferase involved in cell wall biosynthesis
MAAGLSVVGLDTPGVSEVIKDKENGRLLAGPSFEKFTDCLQWTNPKRQVAYKKYNLMLYEPLTIFLCPVAPAKC